MAAECNYLDRNTFNDPTFHAYFSPLSSNAGGVAKKKCLKNLLLKSKQDKIRVRGRVIFFCFLVAEGQRGMK